MSKKLFIDESDKIHEGCIKGQNLNAYLASSRPSSYMFKMSSDSMIEEGIFKGDVIVCSRDTVVKDGDLLVVSVNGKFMLRKLKDGENPVLLSGNHKYPPIEVKKTKSFQLFGVVISVIRKNVKAAFEEAKNKSAQKEPKDALKYTPKSLDKSLYF